MPYGNHHRKNQPSATRDETPRSTEKWIDWQLHQYFSLATPSSSSEGQSKYQGGQRHWWESLADHWRKGAMGDAVNDIIVQFANDNLLRRSLQAIAKSPTSRLVTVRNQVLPGKPLHIDAFCLRNLEQKPGNTLLQKATMAPRILSLQRTQSYQTLENRIFQYVLEELMERSKKYLHTNEFFKQSQHVRDVDEFRVDLERIFRQTSHFHTSSPPLAILPNNSLLYDKDYNVIWMTYKRLLLMERVTQDAWKYQDTLWRETGRQLFGSILSSSLPECLPLARSCAYIKCDMQEGRWSERSSFPGPFQWQTYQLSFLDRWDQEVDSVEAIMLEKLDADQLLIATSSPLIDQTWIALWYHHLPFEQDFDPKIFIDSCDKAIREMATLQRELMGGVIIGSAPFGARVNIDRQGSIVYVSIPPDLSSEWDEIVSAIQLAFTSLLEDHEV